MAAGDRALKHRRKQFILTDQRCWRKEDMILFRVDCLQGVNSGKALECREKMEGLFRRFGGGHYGNSLL